MAATDFKHEHWSSRFAFIMAAVGAAVGLGNFWRFPYEAGQNGGGAFVIVYIGCVVLIGLPLVMAETMIGRNKGLSAVRSVSRLSTESGSSSAWGIIGWLAMGASFLILSFYSVIAGWVLAFIPEAASGAFVGTEAEIGGMFSALIADPQRMLIWHSVFMVITVAIVARGLHNGVEFAAKVLMPAFFVMLLGIVAYSVTAGDFDGAIDFLFATDFSKITVTTAVSAIGQAFFSLGVASAILITYGAYLDKDTNIPSVSFMIASADTLVAILAGLAIFPLVLAFSIDPAGGPGLIFVVLPQAFSQLPELAGLILGTVFFILAFVAALTSSIALLELQVAYAEEFGIPRPVVAVGIGLAIWGLGILNALSFSNPEMVTIMPEGLLGGVSDRTVFGTADFLSSSVLMPLGGFLTAIFVGWVVNQQVVKDELRLSGPLYGVFLFFVRFVVPIAIGIVLVGLVYGAITGSDLFEVLFGTSGDAAAVAE